MLRFLVLPLALVACAAVPTTAASQSASAPPAAPTLPITIKLVHDSDDERATRDQLTRLLQQYDLRPWLYTRAVHIDADAIPYSHPVLTLHARHVRDDLLLLSTFVHEESHWYLDQHADAVVAALPELHALLPTLPVGYPDGAKDERSSYEHLIVIALEERGLQRLVGELAAHQAMEFWAGDHYRAVYRAVLEHRREIRAIMRAHGLAPPCE